MCGTRCWEEALRERAGAKDRESRKAGAEPSELVRENRDVERDVVPDKHRPAEPVEDVTGHGGKRRRTFQIGRSNPVNRAGAYANARPNETRELVVDRTSRVHAHQCQFEEAGLPRNEPGRLDVQDGVAARVQMHGVTIGCIQNRAA